MKNICAKYRFFWTLRMTLLKILKILQKSIKFPNLYPLFFTFLKKFFKPKNEKFLNQKTKLFQIKIVGFSLKIPEKIHWLCFTQTKLCSSSKVASSLFRNNVIVFEFKYFQKLISTITKLQWQASLKHLQSKLRSTFDCARKPFRQNKRWLRFL